MDESYTVFVVQMWSEQYGFWDNCAELPDSVFAPPKVGYDTFDEAAARYEYLRGASPKTRYRVIERTTMSRVLVTM